MSCRHFLFRKIQKVSLRLYLLTNISTTLSIPRTLFYHSVESPILVSPRRMEFRSPYSLVRHNGPHRRTSTLDPGVFSTSTKISTTESVSLSFMRHGTDIRRKTRGWRDVSDCNRFNSSLRPIVSDTPSHGGWGLALTSRPLSVPTLLGPWIMATIEDSWSRVIGIID